MSRRHHTLRTRLVAALLGSAAGLALTACGSGQITQTDAQTSAVDGASGEVGGMVVRNAFLAFPEAADEAPTTAPEETTAEEGETQASIANSYSRGADVPIVATFVNVGKTADELVEVRTPVSRIVEIDGPDRFEPKSSITSTDEVPLAVATPASTPASASASGSTSTSASGTTSASGSASASASASGGASASAAPSGSASASTSASGESETSTAPGAPSASAAPAPTATTPDNQLRIVLTNTREAVRAGLPVEITFVFAEAGELTLDLPVGPPEGRGEFEVPEGVGPAQIAKIERLEEQLSGKVEEEAVEQYAEENGISHEDLEKIRESHGDGDEAGEAHPEAGGSGGH